MKLIAGLVAIASATDCPTGWAAGTDAATADDCFPEGVFVTCGSSTISITADINSVYFDGNAELSDEQKGKAVVVPVNPDGCTEEWTYDAGTEQFTITHDLTTCGTQADHDATNNLLVFSNEYTGTETALSVDGIITTKVLSFSAQCSYPDTATVTAEDIDVTMGENVAEAVAGDSAFEFSLSTYTADDSQLISANNKAEIGEQIKLTVTPDAALPSNVQFQLTGCTAGDSITGDDFPATAVTYDILGAGSCVSELLDASISGDGQSNTDVSLLFNSFTFAAEDDQLALKCSIKLCLTTDDTCNQAAQDVGTGNTCDAKYQRDAWWVGKYDG